MKYRIGPLWLPVYETSNDVYSYENMSLIYKLTNGLGSWSSLTATVGLTVFQDSYTHWLPDRHYEGESILRCYISYQS